MLLPGCQGGDPWVAGGPHIGVGGWPLQLARSSWDSNCTGVCSGEGCRMAARRPGACCHGFAIVLKRRRGVWEREIFQVYHESHFWCVCVFTLVVSYCIYPLPVFSHLRFWDVCVNVDVCRCSSL